MKKLLGLLILIIWNACLEAQTGTGTSGGQQLTDAPALEDSTEIVEPDPVRDRMCFDKIMKVKTSTSRGPATVCVYVNTKIGLVAYSPLKPGTLELCGIKQELPEFALNVNSLKGGSFQYFNRKKKNALEKWVITGNNMQNQFQFVMNSMLVLRRKSDTRTYCDGKVLAVAYRAEGRSETWFIYGKSFPDKLVMQPKKYMGNFAVGFQYTDHGTYIIMEFESTAMGSKIMEMKETETCFDPSGYSRFVEVQALKTISTIQRKREKLNEELSRADRKDHCVNETKLVIQQRLEVLDHEEQEERERLQESRQNNSRQDGRRPAQSSQTAQSPEPQLIYEGVDHDALAQSAILETRLKICQAEYQLSRSSGSANRLDQQYRDRLQTRIECLQRTLSRQIQVQEEYERINRQETSLSARYMRKMKRMADLLVKCNVD